ncbi:hypothetical protein KKG41_04000 [Patescibacteria group bacterium]|nr:hypothetical protein [Patescibacteria group bacterium]MBU1891039.1 hypothetical protein [Patescibacteria group bacterium]
MSFESPRFEQPLESSETEVETEIETEENEREFTKEGLKALQEMSVEPYTKIELILTKTGLRSVANIELTSDTWREQEGEKPKEVDIEKLENIKRSLITMGFVFKCDDPKIEKLVVVEKDVPEGEIKPEDQISEEREKIIISTANEQIDLDKYLQALESNSDEELGEMYGFPESAVDAYSKNNKDESELIARKDLPEIIRKQDWSLFAAFRMSKENWENELETAKKWAETVKKICPEIYKEYIEYMKRVENY